MALSEKLEPFERFRRKALGAAFRREGKIGLRHVARRTKRGECLVDAANPGLIGRVVLLIVSQRVDPGAGASADR